MRADITKYNSIVKSIKPLSERLAAVNRHGWVPGGGAVAGVCKQPGELGFGVGGSDVCCAGAALRRHPAGTPADSTPQVSWALGGGAVGVLPRCNQAESIRRRYGSFLSLHRLLV